MPSVRLVISTVTLGWIVAYLVSRVLIFREGYSRALAEYASDVKMSSMCREHSELRENALDLCRDRIARAEITPNWRAVEYVVHRTYLCGSTRCTDALPALVEVVSGVGSTLIITALVTTLLVFVLWRLLRFIVGGTMTRDRRGNIDRERAVEARLLEYDYADANAAAEAAGEARRIEPAYFNHQYPADQKSLVWRKVQNQAE